MKPVIDAFWRALLYCLHPRVIALSFVPLVLLVGLGLAAAYWGWDPAVEAVRDWIETQSLLAGAVRWLTFLGAGGLRSVVAPLIVVAISLPILVMICLLAVSMFMTPAVVALVAERRFVDLVRKRGAGLMTQIAWAFGSTLLALLALVVSLPLWLVPLVVLVLPPLIWGWLTYRVLAFDALADHASSEERRAILREHRTPLLLMGIFTGYLGTAPGVIGVSGAMTIALAPIVLPLALWIYTLVFAFSSAWFAHYALHALDLRRKAEAASGPPPTSFDSTRTAVIDIVAKLPASAEPLLSS